MKKESEEHKLHEQYTLNRAFQRCRPLLFRRVRIVAFSLYYRHAVARCRFDGLFEAEWAKMQSMDFESTLDAPDTSESLGEAVKSELRAEIAQLTGLPVSFLGSNEEK